MVGVLPVAFRELEQAVALFSEEGVPKDYNPATKQLLGYSEQEFRHLSLADLIAPRADLNEADVREYLSSAAAGNHETFEWQIQRSNGETRWVELIISPITLDGSQYVLGEFRDLTEYKARGRRLQLLYRVLRHNLRNEMNVIQGHAENLEEAIEQDDIKHQIEVIRDTAHDVGELSDAVSNLERLVEKDASVRERTKVAEVVQLVVTELQEKYPETTIEVTIEEETYVSVDEGFRLALEHAIANAVEHNDTDDSRVTITHDATDREAIITIEDNGPGIPEMEIDALESTPTAVEHGSGLGLTVIQSCTRSLGGEIDINTTQNAGSKLTIQLPRLVEETHAD